MYLAYSLLTLVLFVVVSPYFLYQAIRYKKYIGSLRQRLGFLPITFNIDGEESIWIHAVSVGEALTARALAADLKARYPRLRLFLSTTTIAGQQVARRSLSDVDAVFYFPFDWTFIVRRTLRLVRPRLFIMMETEIWPNLLRECRRRGVKTVMINGRISSRSYPRYRLIRPFFRRVLADVDRFCVQSEESARRLVDLGADPARVTVTGSLKFDSLELPGRRRARQAARARAALLPPLAESHGPRRRQHDARRRGGGAPRVRQHQGDDAERAAGPGAAPPGAVRRSRAARARRRLRHRSALRAADRRRAARRRRRARHDRRAGAALSGGTAVFVGGSLVDHGGHNILEPAIFGKPIVFGPHMQNFKEIADAFLSNDAAIQVQSERELDEALLALVTDPVRRARLGAAARALVEANRGAKTKTLAVIGELLPPATTGTATAGGGPSLPPGALIQTLSQAYGAAAAWRRAWYARDPSRRRRLERPVISVGNLRVGGSGKTPIVEYIARLLLAAGRASGDPDARLRAARRRATASRSCPTARACSPASTKPATSR